MLQWHNNCSTSQLYDYNHHHQYLCLLDIIIHFKSESHLDLQQKLKDYTSKKVTPIQKRCPSMTIAQAVPSLNIKNR